MNPRLSDPRVGGYAPGEYQVESWRHGETANRPRSTGNSGGCRVSHPFVPLRATFMALLAVAASGCAGVLEDAELEPEEPGGYETLPGYTEFPLENELQPDPRPEPEPYTLPDQPSPQRRPPGYRCRLKVVVSEPSPPLIRATIRRHENEVRACYNHALRRDPTLRGRVRVQFAIDSSGKVPAAAWMDSQIGDKRMLACITRAVRTWTFPVAPDSGISMVTYPWVFSVPSQ